MGHDLQHCSNVATRHACVPSKRPHLLATTPADSWATGQLKPAGLSARPSAQAVAPGGGCEKKQQAGSCGAACDMHACGLLNPAYLAASAQCNCSGGEEHIRASSTTPTTHQLPGPGHAAAGRTTVCWLGRHNSSAGQPCAGAVQGPGPAAATVKPHACSYHQQLLYFDTFSTFMIRSGNTNGRTSTWGTCLELYCDILHSDRHAWQQLACNRQHCAYGWPSCWVAALRVLLAAWRFPAAAAALAACGCLADHECHT